MEDVHADHCLLIGFHMQVVYKSGCVRFNKDTLINIRPWFAGNGWSIYNSAGTNYTTPCEQTPDFAMKGAQVEWGTRQLKGEPITLQCSIYVAGGPEFYPLDIVDPVDAGVVNASTGYIGWASLAECQSNLTTLLPRFTIQHTGKLP